MKETENRKYIYSVGRRKASTATIHFFEKGTGDIKINTKDWKTYFPLEHIQQNISAPLLAVGLDGKIDLSVKVIGGGFRGQAESIRLGITRALIKYNESFRTTLKNLGFLTRDARVKERKKFGLKKARRAPQWSKR